MDPSGNEASRENHSIRDPVENQTSGDKHPTGDEKPQPSENLASRHDHPTGGQNQPPADKQEENPADEVVDVIDYLKLTVEDVKAMTFKSVEEAEKFYSAYSLALSFGYRRDTKGAEIDGMTRRRQWLCDKQGIRAAKWMQIQGRVCTPRRMTRANCRARFRVNYSEIAGCFIVKAFVPEHSHMLETGNQTAFLRSHRNVGKADLAITNTMFKVSIRPCHAYEYMVEQAGGYKTVGFTMKDLYNKLDQQRRTTPFESDSEAALAYMKALASHDPFFYCWFNVDEEDRLADMFWRDGHSFVDYMCFRDVLIFDSTYKTNVYEKPLVLFVGSNNHRGSIVFGAALLAYETVETYNWVLRAFLHSMNEKKPNAVLTDGDEAMRRAIDEVMPEAKHRLYCWHISRNANTNLKSELKLKVFNRCMKKFQSVEQFEVMWQEMLEEFDLHNCSWIHMMYEKRERWAQAFFGKHFLAGMRSMQRCEGMNRFIKDFVGAGVKLVECIPMMDRALMRLRNNQVRDDFNTINSTPVLETHLEELENHASSVYTYDVFKWVRKEIKESKLSLREGPVNFEDHRVYNLSLYNRPQFQFEVVYHYYRSSGGNCTTGQVNDNEGVANTTTQSNNSVSSDEHNCPIMVCSCKIFQYRGVPCRHMFSVMKHEHMSEIPESLIVKRWLKSARTVCSIKPLETNVSKDAMEMTRYGALSADYNRMSIYASKTEAGYTMLKTEINRLTAIMEGLWKDRKQDFIPSEPAKSGGRVLRDPVTAKIKGSKGKNDNKYKTPRRPMSCGFCSAPGHTAPKCKARLEKEQAHCASAQQNVGEENGTPMNAPPPTRIIHCGFCGDPGHTHRKCEKKKNQNSSGNEPVQCRTPSKTQPRTR